jgi:hypothetical protein
VPAQLATQVALGLLSAVAAGQWRGLDGIHAAAAAAAAAGSGKRDAMEGGGALESMRRMQAAHAALEVCAQIAGRCARNGMMPYVDA